jgi:hypothetical protein
MSGDRVLLAANDVLNRKHNAGIILVIRDIGPGVVNGGVVAPQAGMPAIVDPENPSAGEGD